MKLSEDDIAVLMKKQSEIAPTLRRLKKIAVPRREPSVTIPERKMVFTSADKTICEKCICFPKEDPYRKHKRLRPCLQSPPFLYELAAEVVDNMPYPAPFTWSVEEVAKWMDGVVGLPQYRDCILDNHINGLRLLMLEDPSNLPEMNIHYFEHIKMITSQVRKEFSTDFVEFVRSIGLPPRRPGTLCTGFKSRTGPSWGIRKNWSRTDILRWMKILMPEPVHLDHWDLVWYQRPDFPKVLFARLPQPKRKEAAVESNAKALKKVTQKENPTVRVPRRFIIMPQIPPEEQYIWMEQAPTLRKILADEKTPRTPSCARERQKRGQTKKGVTKFVIKEDSRLFPKKINTEGLKGKELILARRKRNKTKFLR